MIVNPTSIIMSTVSLSSLAVPLFQFLSLILTFLLFATLLPISTFPFLLPTFILLAYHIIVNSVPFLISSSKSAELTSSHFFEHVRHQKLIWYNVGKTTIDQPFGNVKKTTYLCYFGGWCTWHCFTNIIVTLCLFNIAMENSPFIDDFPIKTSIYTGSSMAMLNNQMVCLIIILFI